MRWVKRVVVIVILLGLVAATALAMRPKPVVVELGHVTRGTLEVVVKEDGQSRVRERYVITAPLGGHIDRIELRAGDPVDVGASLVRITPIESPLLDRRSREQVEAQFAAASASVRRAKAMTERVDLARDQALRDLERVKSLAKGGAVSEHVLETAEVEAQSLGKEADAAKLGVRVAQHELEMARAALMHGGAKDGKPTDQFTIACPIKGSVLRVHQESSGVVAPGTPLLEIGDLSKLEVAADLLTTDSVEVRANATVTLERWGGKAPLKGIVRRVEPSAFTKISALGVEEQRVLVLIDPVGDDREWAVLGDGYRVEASILVWHGDDVLKLPSSAAFRHDNGWAVFTIVDGKAKRAPIELGRRSGLEVQVVSGLEEGAAVVLHPSDEVSEGVRVQPQ